MFKLQLDNHYWDDTHNLHINLLDWTLIRRVINKFMGHESWLKNENNLK